MRRSARFALILLCAGTLTFATACSAESTPTNPSGTATTATSEISGDASSDATATDSATPSEENDGSTGNSSGQSVADACQAIATSVSDAGTALAGLDTSDPAASAAALREMADGLAATASSVSNEQVAPVVAQLGEAYGKLATILEAVTSGDVSQLGEMETVMTDFQTTLNDFSALCAGQ